ncbi:MAG TPA: IS481 family transposase, partial [Anaerolineaceae bacterium]|nr:IS481 family transposase [Anaerolineaceae bacterium]
MPWKEANLMSLRTDFIALATKENANISELCRQFRISRKTGY